MTGMATPAGQRGAAPGVRPAAGPGGPRSLIKKRARSAAKMGRCWAIMALAATLLVSLPAGAMAQAPEIDIDGDGVPDSVDECPHVLEDRVGEIDGCPSDFVPWYDTDNDGIEDRLDLCPTVKERYNRHLDEDGCPDVVVERGSASLADTDGDGFIDVLDSCPNEPETPNGILDGDGCPDDYVPLTDNDEDAVPDSVDACPFEQETYNRFMDGDGCPDEVETERTQFEFPDTDGDGIDDRWDQCPDEAENRNSYLDWDGCADEPGFTSRGDRAQGEGSHHWNMGDL